MKRKITLALALALLVSALSSCVDAPPEKSGTADHQTVSPTLLPSSDPSGTAAPTLPEGDSSADPSGTPSGIPSGTPSGIPSGTPGTIPTEDASADPSAEPSAQETAAPTDPPRNPIPEEIAHMADLDFGGKEIIIAISEFTSTEIPLESHEYITGPNRIGADKVMNEIYKRNLDVSETLGIKPRYVYTNNNYAGVLPDIMAKVHTGGKNCPDLYIDQAYGMIRAQMEGYLKNTNAENSHIDFGEKGNDNGWYDDYMKGFNFGSDEKNYLLAGDYFMDVFRMLNLTAVNLIDFKTKFWKNGGADLLYNTVTEGKWTVDRMIEWSNAFYRDVGSKPTAIDKDDELGILLLDHSPLGMLPSAGVSLYRISEDYKTYTVANDSNAALAIDKWRSATRSHGAYDMTLAEEYEFYQTFTNGKVLFAPGIDLYRLETEEFKNMPDNKCLLPYPKVVETAPYRVETLSHARVGAILANTEAFEETTAWVQASTLTSQDVFDVYCNEALAYKYGTEYGSLLVMNLIYESISAPLGIIDESIINITNVFFDVYRSPVHYRRIIEDETDSYDDLYDAAERALTEALRIYQEKFDNLK